MEHTMTDLIEHIRRLAATGATPAAIAAQIGKSRQWVYVICKRENIPFSGRAKRIVHCPYCGRNHTIRR
jgi:hypothetical protein